ncbi:MAG: NifB/NifX family molybdenum-iron cluster-binding protein [Candidatus Aquicultorales bacterium]
MKVGFAVEEDQGIDSKVYGHFGSAPFFLVTDVEGTGLSTVNNKDMHHEHGACNPVRALGGYSVDAIVVGGIGAGALNGLNAQGIKVFKALADTVKDNLDLFKKGALPELSLHHTCGGHRGGCGH